MYLKKAKNNKTGRTYLTIAHSYHDSKTKTSRTKTIQSLGYLDELEKLYDNPIEHFTKIAKEMTEEYKNRNKPVDLSINLNQALSDSQSPRKNFGYIVLSYIYHFLEIDKFFNHKQRHTKEEFSGHAIMKLLVYGRMIHPSSKCKTFNEKDMFFDKFDFSLDDVYRCLSLFNKHKEELQLWIHQKISGKLGRNTDLVYYDVTNYFFEIDKEDDLRKKGFSKEKRNDPIVQMGLFMDTNGIPISYKLFPGNTVDCSTLIPTLSDVQRKYSLGRTVIVADRGLTTGDNIYYTLSAKNGYVLSYSIRKASSKFQEYVLNPTGYHKQTPDFKIKSRLEPREINVTLTSGKKKKFTVDEKHVVFYSRKHAEKAKKEREKVIAKAKDLIKSPSKYDKASSKGAAKYVNNIAFNKETGEILENIKHSLSFDEEKLKEEEKFDGYYAIVTSEYKLSDSEIVDIYRGLWKIEESFKVTKSDIQTRPVYVSREDHIEGHFLTCFVSLVISRLLEKKIDYKYPVPKILQSLRKSSCSHLQENYYLFNYYDEILRDLGEIFNIDFDKKFMTLKKIKKILAESKKRDFTL